MPIFDEDSMDSKNTIMSGQHLTTANGGSNNTMSGMSKAEIRKVNLITNGKVMSRVFGSSSSCLCLLIQQKRQRKRGSSIELAGLNLVTEVKCANPDPHPFSFAEQ